LVPVPWATILVTGNNLCPLPITTKVASIKEKACYQSVGTSTLGHDIGNGHQSLLVTNVELKNKKIHSILLLYTYMSTQVYNYI
jgi:hypothetical protein